MRKPKIRIKKNGSGDFVAVVYSANGYSFAQTDAHTRKDHAKRAAQRLIDVCKQDPEIREET